MYRFWALVGGSAFGVLIAGAILWCGLVQVWKRDYDDDTETVPLDPRLDRLGDDVYFVDKALYWRLMHGKMLWTRRVVLDLDLVWYRLRPWRGWITTRLARVGKVIDKVVLALYVDMPGGVYVVPGWSFVFRQSQSDKSKETT